MVSLLLITFFSFSVSFVSQLFLLLAVDIPSNNIAIVLNVVLVLSFSTRLLLTKEFRYGKSWFLDDSIKHICPRWLKTGTILIMIYGIVTSVVYLIRTFSRVSVAMTEADYIIASRELFIAVFSLLLVCYAVEFMLNFSFRILKRRVLRKNPFAIHRLSFPAVFSFVIKHIGKDEPFLLANLYSKELCYR